MKEIKILALLELAFYQRDRVNKIHVQNRSIWGGNLVSATEKSKAGKAKGGQRRPHDAFTPHHADFSGLSPTAGKPWPLISPLQRLLYVWRLFLLDCAHVHTCMWLCAHVYTCIGMHGYAACMYAYTCPPHSLPHWGRLGDRRQGSHMQLSRGSLHKPALQRGSCMGPKKQPRHWANATSARHMPRLESSVRGRKIFLSLVHPEGAPLVNC